MSGVQTEWVFLFAEIIGNTAELSLYSDNEKQHLLWNKIIPYSPEMGNIYDYLLLQDDYKEYKRVN